MYYTGNFNIILQLASQQPYAEQFIGEPHVYTININDLQQVKETIKKILAKDSVSYHIQI